MNRKQLISLWCGIAAVVFCGFVIVVDAWRPNYAQFSVWVFLIALVAGGMILTFTDRRPRGNLNAKRGFRRVTLILSALAIVICSILGVGELLEDYPDFAEGWVPFAVGFGIGGALWAAYLIVFWIITPIMRWIVKGFEYIPDISRDE